MSPRFVAQGCLGLQWGTLTGKYGKGLLCPDLALVCRPVRHPSQMTPLKCGSHFVPRPNMRGCPLSCLWDSGSGDPD